MNQTTRVVGGRSAASSSDARNRHFDAPLFPSVDAVFVWWMSPDNFLLLFAGLYVPMCVCVGCCRILYASVEAWISWPQHVWIIRYGTRRCGRFPTLQFLYFFFRSGTTI